MEQDNDTLKDIESDSKFVFKLIKDILIFLITLIPYLLMGIIHGILLNKEDSINYFKKVFVFPFEILNNLSTWFFQAKYTAFTTLFLILTFVLQIIFLNPNEQLLQYFMTHSISVTSILFYTNLTSIFLHGSITHLLSNLLALTIFGRIVESNFKEKMIYIFLAAGFIANIISNTISLFSGDMFYSLGASGAIAGLIIMAILLKPFQFSNLLIIPLPIFLIGWFLIFLDISGLSNPNQTNNLAHIGGYLSLIILMFTLEIKNRNKIYIGLAINVMLLIILYILNTYFDLLNLI
ncbi:MAG: rhomboid family intramembrane serine protease [Nanoarchaeales archaeon]|nr:rhomboid family intramembrane serine protease [Nanoarchaeales archaeon]